MKNALWAACGILIVLLVAAILYPVFVHETVPALSTRCMRNLNKLGMASEMYMSEHDHRFPPVKTWNDALKAPLARINSPSKSIDELLRCPSERDDSQPSYAVNARLDGLSAKDIADPTVVVRYFESIPGRNLYGGPELFSPEPRHQDGYAILFVDGHVEFVPKSEIGRLRWDPKPPHP